MITALTLQQKGEETKTAIVESMPHREMLSFHLEMGFLHVDLAKPDDFTQGRVWVSGVRPHSPCLGQLQVGDWLESINGYPLAGKGLTFAAELIRSASHGPRFLQVSRPLAINPTSVHSVDMYAHQMEVQDKESSNNRTAHTAITKEPVESTAPEMQAQMMRVVNDKENSNNRITQGPDESSTPKIHASTVRVVQENENSNSRTTHPAPTEDPVESPAPEMHAQTEVQEKKSPNTSIGYPTTEPADVFGIKLPENTENANGLYAQMVAQADNVVQQDHAAAPGGAHNTYAQMVVQGNETTMMESLKPEASPRVKLTVLQQPTAIPVDVLLLMKEEELQLECIRRCLPSTVGKTALLESLGVPVQTWKSWSKMKVSELKDILRSKDLKVSGKKSELLQRLGVPIGFGETQLEKSQRKLKELKRKKEPEEKPKSNKKVKLSDVKASSDPRDDPSHVEFMEACCNNPSFPAWNDPTQPIGCIHFPDGSLMEVWRCLTCGNIPNFPNAPPVEEFPNDESNMFLMYGGLHFL